MERDQYTLNDWAAYGGESCTTSFSPDNSESRWPDDTLY